MLNTWGQEISIGSVVYRGARSGSSSEYKIGVVQSFSKDKPRVNWLFANSGRWLNIGGKKQYHPHPYALETGSYGTLSIESIVLVDVDLEEIARIADFFSKIGYKYEFNSIAHLNEELSYWRKYV